MHLTTINKKGLNAMIRMGNYEKYILDRADLCGYHNRTELAAALNMCVSTLNSRLRMRSDWTIQECKDLSIILDLLRGDWILLTLFRVTPYDYGYDEFAHMLFDHIRWGNHYAAAEEECDDGFYEELDRDVPEETGVEEELKTSE